MGEVFAWFVVHGFQESPSPTVLGDVHEALGHITVAYHKPMLSGIHMLVPYRQHSCATHAHFFLHMMHSVALYQHAATLSNTLTYFSSISTSQQTPNICHVKYFF